MGWRGEKRSRGRVGASAGPFEKKIFGDGVACSGGAVGGGEDESGEVARVVSFADEVDELVGGGVFEGEGDGGRGFDGGGLGGVVRVGCRVGVCAVHASVSAHGSRGLSDWVCWVVNC